LAPVLSIRPSHADVMQRAHEIWLREGRPEGRAEAHWFEAERELLRANS